MMRGGLFALGEIRVLPGQRRQVAAGIEGVDFAKEHADGPAIGHDVVHGDEQIELRGRALDDAGAQQGIALEIEGANHVSARLFERDEGDGDGALRGDYLVIGEVRAQGVVAADDLIEGALELRAIERSR